MGDVVILLHADDLEEHIPEDSHRIFISSIKQTIDTASIFIRCTVKKRWPTQKTRNGSLIKVVLADGEHDADSINCFFVSDLANQGDVIAVGDTVLLSKFFIENSTNPALSSHACQLLLDKRRSRPLIVILHSQQQQQPPTTNANDANLSPVASTSEQQKQSRQSTPTKATTPKSVTTASASVATSSVTSTARPVIQGQGPKVATSYTYTKLKNLVKDTMVNVYGVIKFVKQPFRTRGTDYMMLVSIVDSSLDSLSHKLKCVLFAREQSAFPTQTEVGDIIRMHRLKINEFNGELQGKNGPAFSFLLFDNATSASLTPKFKSTNHYTITEEDYNRVTELRTWWSSLQLQDPEEETPLPRSLTLADVQCGSYFDLTCQVVAVCAMTPRDGCLLKVWDGTKTVVPVYDVDTGENEVQCDATIVHQVADYIVDVCVFDNHFERGSYCQPGHYVKFYNLHAMKHKSTAVEEQHCAVPMVELCLHGGTSYGRGLRIFDETDQQIQSLKKRLESLKDTLDDSPEPSQLTANQSTPQRVTRNSLTEQKTPLGETTNQSVRRSPRLKAKGSPQKNSRKRSLEASPSTSAKRHSETGVTESSESNGTPMCMVNTATVIIGHRHIPQTSIRDIQNHSVPYKFRVHARLMDYQPKVNTARDLLKLYCPKCHYLSPLPESKAAIDSPNSWAAKASADTVENGIPRFCCPSCSKHLQHKSAESRMLKYIYMFQLIIYDESGWLVAQLMKDEAGIFFDTSAEELLRKRSIFQWVQARLRELCPSRARDKTRPLMEMCVKSYSTPNVGMGTSYQVFDTSLASLQDSA